MSSSSTSASSTAQTAPASFSMLDQFIDLFSKFLEALRTTFPKCKATAEYYNDYQKAVVPSTYLQRKVIEKWHATLSPYYDACRKKDENVFLDPNTKIEFLDKVNFRKKWQGLRQNPSSVDHMWQFVQELNRFAAIYMEVPAAIRQNMESVSSGVFKDIMNGKLDISQLDVQALGSQVLNGASDMDAMELVKGMGKIWETVGTADNVQEQMGPNAPKLPDFNKLVKGLNAMSETRADVVQDQNMKDVLRDGWRPPS